MKKILCLALWVFLAVPGFSTQPNLAGKVAREVARQQLRAGGEQTVLEKLNDLRQFIGTMQEEDTNAIMDAVLEFADVFFEYAAENPELKTQEFAFRKGVNIRKLVREIETPMKVGWGAQEKFVVSYAIDRFFDGGLRCPWRDEASQQQLLVFEQALLTYSPTHINVDTCPISKVFLKMLPRPWH